MPTLTVRQWLYIALAATLLFGGWYFRDLVLKKEENKQLKDENSQLVGRGEKYDRLVSDNIEEGATIDRGVSRASAKNQEAARHDPTYRDYLDRPLPESSLQLYRDAAAAVAAARGQGADDAGAAADQADH